jgi:thiamine-phosphate pyrophosphorylase
MISNFHFISQETAVFSHLESIEKACQAGVDWVQLRVKNKSLDEIAATAEKAKSVCDSFNVKLVINDHPSVAKEIGAYGLHLGKEDMPVNEARKIVGPDMIIGGTANTVEDIVQHVKHGANYIGCGPFRFTTTKVKLSPILGLEGYRRIISEIRDLQISIPIIAIGGIEVDDIPAIMGTGMWGIAGSSFIALASDSEGKVLRIKKLLNREQELC